MLLILQVLDLELFIILSHPISISSLYQLFACDQEVKGAPHAEKISFQYIIYRKFDSVLRGEQLAETSEFQDHWVYIARCADQPCQELCYFPRILHNSDSNPKVSKCNLVLF